MTTGRFDLHLCLDLRRLRILLAVVAIMLGVVAAAPHGASAEPNTGGGTDATAGAKKDCENAGGTWTIDGAKATCTGMGWPKDYSCDLTINPKGTACSHLPKPRMVSTGGGVRVARGNTVAAVSRAVDPTPAPTSVAVDPATVSSAAVDGSQMAPLDE